MTCPLCQKRQDQAGLSSARQGHLHGVLCRPTGWSRSAAPVICAHLSAGTLFPSAGVKRQRESDLRALMAGVGRMSEAQVQLFFMIQSYAVEAGARRRAFAQLTLEVADAASVLAATFDTASRGIISRATRAPPRNGQRLVAELKEVLLAARKGWRQPVRTRSGRRADAPSPMPQPPVQGSVSDPLCRTSWAACSATFRPRSRSFRRLA